MESFPTSPTDLIDNEIVELRENDTVSVHFENVDEEEVQRQSTNQISSTATTDDSHYLDNLVIGNTVTVPVAVEGEINVNSGGGGGGKLLLGSEDYSVADLENFEGDEDADEDADEDDDYYYDDEYEILNRNKGQRKYNR